MWRASQPFLSNLRSSAADLPEIREVDLNPLLADETGVIAVDARVAIAPVDREAADAIGHPSLCHPALSEGMGAAHDAQGRHRDLRAAGPAGGRTLVSAVSLPRVSQEDLRLRFFAPVKEFGHAFIARFTQLDYARAMAFIAIDEASGEMLGVARLHANSTYDTAEYAVLVRSDLKGNGLGWLLMQIDHRICPQPKAYRPSKGKFLMKTPSMLRMCAELGFTITPDPNEPHISIVGLALTLNQRRTGVLTILRLPFCTVCAASIGALPFPAIGSLRSRRDLMSKIMIVVGHPQRTTFCEALGRAYARGAASGGHDAKLFILSEMNFDAILHEGYRKEQPLEPDLRVAYETLRSSDHVVLIFPLWCGDMPAMLKGFIERILQPDLIARANTDSAMNWNIFNNKSARIIMTMGMPVSIYRWWYGGHALKLLTRNILHFIGIKPVRQTLYGMIETSKPAARERWLREVEALGQTAS